MPEILHRCVEHVMGQGHDEPSAYAICRVSLNLSEDGSKDSEEVAISERDMLIAVASEITKRQFSNFPRVRKWMPLCEAVGEYVNGEYEGSLTVRRFQKMIRNQQEHPRQIPVFLLTGNPDSEHPADLDSRLADGWVEGLKLEGDMLWGDVVLNGNAAVAVLQDGVRGASIGTVKAASYDGTPIGEALEHVVLTNEPFVKGMNIAATSRQTGGQKIAYHFTALNSQETEMPEKDLKGTASDKGKPPEKAEDLNLTEKVTALECLLQEKEGQIRELTASRDNALEELKLRQQNAQTEMLLNENKKLNRRLDALRVRELVNMGLMRGQFTQERVRGYEGGENRSDEVTLAWLKGSEFKKLDSLEFALTILPRKTVGQRFNSGIPLDSDGDGYSAEEIAFAREQGKDPATLKKAGKASNFTAWKREQAEAKGA